MRTSRRAAVYLLMVAVLAALSGCGWKGLNSLPLPGTQGRGPGSFEVKAQMADVMNLQQNSRVRVGDVEVGTVTNIQREDWHALVTMSLNRDVDLPANATARLGQTTVLGSLHLELAPPKDQPPQGKLHNGSLIPLSHTGAYPTAEQTLAALSLVLNGGGLGQIQDITAAFSTAFRGREKDLRSLIEQLDKFTAYLNDQKGDIIAASESLNNLAGQFAQQQPVLDRALKTIPDALAVLNKERDTFVEAADAFGRFSALAVDAVNQSKENLVKDLREVGPVLESLANAGPSLTRGLSQILTFPFANETIDKYQRGFPLCWTVSAFGCQHACLAQTACLDPQHSTNDYLPRRLVTP